MNNTKERTLKGDLTTIINKLKIIENAVKNKHDINDKLITLKKVSEYSSMSEMSCRRAIQDGLLIPFKKDGKMLFKLSEVDKWLSS